MRATLRAALDDGPLEDVGDVIDADLRPGELLGDDGERGARGTPDAEGKMARVPPHDGHEEPPFHRRGILHEVAHQIFPEVAGRGEAERHDLAWQGQVVV